MKHEYDSDKLISSNKKLLSWEELLEKGALLKEAIHRLSLMPGMPYLVTKSCTDGTFQKGDVIFLEPENDIFCPKTGRRISPGVHRIIWISNALRQTNLTDSCSVFVLLFQQRL